MPDLHSIPVIGRADELQVLRSHFAGLLKGQGSAVCIAGETGHGKTSLLEAFAQECRDAEPRLVVLNAVCQQPLGALRIGEVQPLYPFRHIMEQLGREDSDTAKKKLYQSIGMTVLATLPLVGEVFYAAKEIARDLREFKRDNKHEKDKVVKFSSRRLVDEYVVAIERMAAHHPLMVLLDDMQWSDAQSTQVLAALVQILKKIPVMILVAYRESELRSIAHPLLPVVETGLAEGTIASRIELRAFAEEDMRLCSRAYLPGYRSNEPFERWLVDHSGGVPGIVVEYLRYFRTHPPFDDKGKFSEQVETGGFIPATVNALFAAALEQLSEEDRTLLGLASVEGRECTVFVLAQLLNTDVLTAVRKLRSLQQRTGILRSRGAELQYGVKTTVYEFIQALHHRFFLQSLEYEERTTIHARIAEILRKQYEQAETEATRESIAPYLAAHSGESGDKETLQAMILRTAYTADRYDSENIVDYLYDVHTSVAVPETPAMEEVNRNFLSLVNTRRQEELVASPDEEAPVLRFGVESYPAVRGAVVEHFLAGRYARALAAGTEFFDEHRKALVPQERIELQTLLARCYSETDQTDRAMVMYGEALASARTLGNREWECLALIGLAILAWRNGDGAHMEAQLHSAVELALTLPREFQLLVSANIATLLKNIDAEEARRHSAAALRLAEELNFKIFAEEAFRNT